MTDNIKKERLEVAEYRKVLPDEVSFCDATKPLTDIDKEAKCINVTKTMEKLITRNWKDAIVAFAVVMKSISCNL